MTDVDRLTIRPAVPDDAPALAALVRRAYRDADAGGWTSEGHLLGDERIDAEQVRAKIARPEAVLLTVRADDRLVGCCEVVPAGPGVAYFGLFAVDPAEQAGGIGRRVLSAAEEVARDRFDATRMEMTVIGQREDLIAWYERRGYATTQERRPFPYDELVAGVAYRDDLYFTVLTKDLRS